MAKEIIAKYKRDFANSEERKQFFDEQRAILRIAHPGAVIEFVDEKKRGAPKIADRLKGRYPKAETVTC